MSDRIRPLSERSYGHTTARIGEYQVRLNQHADEDERGGNTAWEVWHWPTNTVESDWFTPADAHRECLRLAGEAKA